MSSRNMAKQLFLHDLSTTFRQCPPHVRRFHPLNKPHDFPHRISLRSSFSPKTKASFSSSSSSSSKSNSKKVGFVDWYLRKLETYPVITKSITSSLIFTAADLTSQMITSSSSASYDLKRTFRMAIYGGLILGPSQHMWFNFLSKILPNRDLATTLKKILMGQAVFGPVINTVFFSYNGALQGKNGSEIIAMLKRDLLPTLLGGALFWPICDFVTFKYIPVHLQPLMNSSCAYVWTIYLSYMANRTNLTEA
ncbi:PXMP2/4 family protein 4-like [Trifolium pratense]|uniref:PXMP2/4 family protein 4-like n=1 Tax=Trifolium pratense TaxID=57577 RepID=UPI001E69455F|nr:PXMP2/4 family protein 4-like [Trifolium pratense]